MFYNLTSAFREIIYISICNILHYAILRKVAVPGEEILGFWVCLRLCVIYFVLFQGSQ